MLVELLGVAVEVFPVVQPRQAVALGGLDDVPILGKLDGARHAGQYDLPIGIGLGDEVRRAQLQALNLRFLVCREHDHRDVPQLRVLPHGADHVQTVHAGHQQIQQYKRQRILVLADDLQRRFAVRCGQRAVIILQDQLQQLPVHQLVIDDQHEPLSVGGMELFAGFQHKFILFPGPNEQRLTGWKYSTIIKHALQEKQGIMIAGALLEGRRQSRFPTRSRMHWSCRRLRRW